MLSTLAAATLQVGSWSHCSQWRGV